MTFGITLSAGITQHHNTYPFIAPSKFVGTLTGKVVLVTGASRGIGRETALAFAASGASVAALARTAPDIDSLIAEIKAKYNVPALGVIGSVLDDSAKIVAEVEAKLGPIDVLVNNAGIQRIKRFTDETDLQGWWNIMSVNVLAPLSMIHAVSPSFLARKRGIAITVGSAAADISIPFMSSYLCSKAAILKAIQALNLELQSQGIKNFVIHPGAIKTNIADGAYGEEMSEFVKSFDGFVLDKVELPAWSMVALAVLAGDGPGKDERVDMLSGKYWDVNDDLGELLEKKKEIEEKNLYDLRVRKL